jgi:hypothetical protein
MKLFLLALSFAASASLFAAAEPVHFNARTCRSGKWSEPATWADGRQPKAGDFVQVRTGHTVVYDVESAEALRMVHVAGALRFATDRNTRLDVGLLKVAEGEETTEDGFNCHDDPAPAPPGNSQATLEIGSQSQPVPAGVTALVRLVYFEGTDRETLPAIVNCGGRWDVHGAPMERTWLKLGADAKKAAAEVKLESSPRGWRKGDHVIVTASANDYSGSSFRKTARRAKQAQTEERVIAEIKGDTIVLDAPLAYDHAGSGEYRSEIANLSRNVIIESANPEGIRGHTMYHRDSTGGISYAEFRHLGKEGVLGKYAIHFHLVRDTMRGSGVRGASIWDSHNRWITEHGTDYLLVRDCVGYQSVGHGYYLEDGTEQYNVFDRNLAVQAFDGRRLPKQILPFDPNDGAGFWWANGRNTFTRNVACENDKYGYRFEVSKRGFDPVLNLRTPEGTREARDIRSIPFYRFEANESHSEGLYSFNFGDDAHPSVHGDREHPFIARNLVAWDTHYAFRPDVQFLLLDGLKVHQAAYGVYHPDYDAHVYRNIHLDRIGAEPINRGLDDDSIQHGSFTYDGLTIENSSVGRDPLIQMACTSPQPNAEGHFRNVTLRANKPSRGKVVDLGGGPRNDKLENPVAYFFHDFAAPNTITKVVSAKFPAPEGANFQSVSGFTGPDARAAEVKDVKFPELLSPIDDLPPATLITAIENLGDGRARVRGVTHDNGEIKAVLVNGTAAELHAATTGVADWTATIPIAPGQKISAKARDAAGNEERLPSELSLADAR